MIALILTKLQILCADFVLVHVLPGKIHVLQQLNMNLKYI